MGKTEEHPQHSHGYGAKLAFREQWQVKSWWWWLVSLLKQNVRGSGPSMWVFASCVGSGEGKSVASRMLQWKSLVFKRLGGPEPPLLSWSCSLWASWKRMCAGWEMKKKMAGNRAGMERRVLRAGQSEQVAKATWGTSFEGHALA